MLTKQNHLGLVRTLRYRANIRTGISAAFSINKETNSPSRIVNSLLLTIYFPIQALEQHHMKMCCVLNLKFLFPPNKVLWEMTTMLVSPNFVCFYHISPMLQIILSYIVCRPREARWTSCTEKTNSKTCTPRSTKKFTEWIIALYRTETSTGLQKQCDLDKIYFWQIRLFCWGNHKFSGISEVERRSWLM